MIHIIIRDYLPASILHDISRTLDLFTIAVNLFWNRKHIFKRQQQKRLSIQWNANLDFRVNSKCVFDLKRYLKNEHSSDGFESTEKKYAFNE